MADSATNLDQILTAQAQKEVTANALFDAGSPATVFGRRASACVALTWAFYGGMVIIDGVPVKILNGTLTLTDDADNYIEFDDTLSEPAVIVTAASDWTPGLRRLYLVTTASGAATAWEDHRTFGQTRAIDVSVTDAGTYFTATDVEGALQELGAAAFGGGGTSVAALFFGSKPTDAEALWRHTATRAMSLPTGLTASKFAVLTNPTAAMTLTITKNGGSIGTVEFSTGGVPTVTFASPVSFAIDDVIGVDAQGTADATGAGITFGLVFTLD